MSESAVAVVGAGSWGTTIASLVAARGATTLWARSSEVADGINVRGRNPRYLEGFQLPPAVRATTSLAEAVGDAELVLVAVPSHGFRKVLEGMEGFLRPGVPIVSLAKGIEPGTHLRMSEVIAEVLPGHPAGVLSGPNLAHEVAAGQPAATVVALPELAIAERVQELLHRPTFRVYTGTDVVGCEIAGATKNVIALAAGIADGFGFGDNTRAVLVTRGLAELGRLGVALGGHALTFGGLAGIGDLFVTCTSVRSRNRQVGVALGRGQRLSDVLAGMRMVAEGVHTARPLVDLAAAHHVEMPIAVQVAALLEGATSPGEALATLMERPAKPEWAEWEGAALRVESREP